MSAEKTYRLTGGRRITAREVAEETGLARETARKRLLSSRDPAVVLAPPRVAGPAAKVYRLDDGTTGTVQDLAAMVPGLSLEGMINRLDRHGTDAERVLESRAAAKRRWGQAWRTTHRLRLPGTPEFEESTA